MGEILFSMFLSCTIIIAFNLFALESNELFSIQTVIAICDVACLLPSNFTYCFLAEKVTADLLKISDILFSSAWYRLPVIQQKLLVIPIQLAEREYRIKGLRLINCSLAVFVSVSMLKFNWGDLYEVVISLHFTQIISTFLSHLTVFSLDCRWFGRHAPIFSSFGKWANEPRWIKAVSTKKKEAKSALSDCLEFKRVWSSPHSLSRFFSHFSEINENVSVNFNWFNKISVTSLVVLSILFILDRHHFNELLKSPYDDEIWARPPDQLFWKKTTFSLSRKSVQKCKKTWFTLPTRTYPANTQWGPCFWIENTVPFVV